MADFALAVDHNARMGAMVRRYRVPGLLFVIGLFLGVVAYARLGPDAARLDPGVQAGLLLVVSVTLAATAGGAGAIFGASIAAEAARDAAARVQSESRANREDARAARFADRKFALAVDLLRAADLHVREANLYVDARWGEWTDRMELGVESTESFPAIGKTEPVRAAFLALDLVAPAMAAAAEALYRATVPIGQRAAGWFEPTLQNDADYKKWAREWDVANVAWNGARHDFVDAVRADLGVAAGGADAS